MVMRLVPIKEALGMTRDRRRVAIAGEISDRASALALLWCEPLLQPQSPTV
jgi:hypothetical protein